MVRLVICDDDQQWLRGNVAKSGLNISFSKLFVTYLFFS
jgi:hypothetical protein